MAKKHNIQLLVSDYAFYAEKDDKAVQTMIQEGKNKFKSDLHMKSREEFEQYLKQALELSDKEINEILSNNDEWAKNFDGFELKYEWRLADTGSIPALQQCMEIIKKNGRMKWDDPIYVARLREEIQVIAKNGKKDLSGYFLPIVEVLNHYRKNGYLTSIGRGSAGGSLFCFLLEITHIDPIRWNLPFSRFFSMDRILGGKLPDIDIDLPTKELLISKDGKHGFLYERWGDRACQVSSRSKVRLKSAIKDTNRYLNGSVQKEIEILSKSLPQPPQNTDDHDFVFGYIDDEENHVTGLIESSEPLQKYALERPQEFKIVEKAMGLTRAFSVHPCATLISDIPIRDILPTKNDTICQYEHKQAEFCGLIKYDFLTVSQLLDIQECIKLINKKNGDPIDPMYFTHNGEKVFVWDLPQIEEVYKNVWSGETKTLFQIHTPGMANFTKELLPQNMWDISSTLAFQRPGPLDYILEESGRNMAEEYLFRRKGLSKSDIPELAELLPDTYGIICYQEDLNKIARTIAGMDGDTAEKLRENMAKKYMKELEKMKPLFIEGASKKLSRDTSEKIWDQMVTFGRYGFSSIHSTEYSHYTYATMFLRYFYPLEWYASIMTNASEKEISGKLWDVIKGYLAPPDINLSSDKMEIDYANKKIRAKLGVIRGMGEKSIDPIVQGRPYKDIQDFVNRDVAGPSLSRKLIHVGVLDSLFPPMSTLLQKLQLFEDAVEVRKYNQKKEKAEKEGKTIKQLEPNKGKVPEEYLHIEDNPMQNAAIQKSILPSLLVGLYDLGRNHSKCIIGRSKPSRIMNSPNNWEALLVTGEMLERLNDMPGEAVPEDKMVAAIGYVVETKVFDYKKNTRQALKVVADFDGLVKELVLWPDYYTGILQYPQEIKKGNICTFFLKKRANKNDACSIVEIVIEA
jgi:DNA polymerase-3 subunit alpha